MRLTAKFIIAFIFIVFIPIITLGYLSYSSARLVLKQQALHYLVPLAASKKGHIYSFFKTVKNRAMDFSSDRFILDTVEAMQALDAESPRFQEFQKSLNSHLRLSKIPLDEHTQLILVINSAGKVIASTDGREIGKDESMDEYFVKGRTGVYMGDVHSSPHFAGSERPYKIVVSAPLIGRENKVFLGVIVNYYNTVDMDLILSGNYQVKKGAISGNLGSGRNLDIYLVNKQRLLITPSLAGGEVMKQRVTTLPVRECSYGRETTSTYRNYRGDEVIGASICLPDNGWTLLVEISEKQAFAPVAALRRHAIILGIAIELLTLVVAYFFARKIINPVVSLSRLTQKLADGDFSVRVSVESKDEIGELADSFNKMAARLANSQHTILTEKSRLESLINGIDDGIALSDSDGNVVILNKSAEKLFGVKTSNIAGKPVVNCHKGPTRKKVNEILQAFKNGEKNHYLSEMTYKNFDFEVRALSIYKGDAYFGAVMVAHDITKRKRTENELRAKQEEIFDKHEELSLVFKQMEIAKGEWERTMDCMGDMVMLADGNDRLKRCNTAVKELIGTTYDKILGKNWESLLRENGMNPDVFDAQGTEIFHERTGRWFVFRSYPYTKASDYEVSGIVITLHDSTELKHVMEELEYKNMEIDKNSSKLQKSLSEISFLIQQVADDKDFKVRYSEPELKQSDFDPIYQLGNQFNNMMQILELKNSELEDAYEKLKNTQTQILQQDKMASIGQLAAGVAHEINNPMGFISSNIGTLDKYVRRLVEFIDAQAEALESLKAVEALEQLNNTRKKLKLDYIVNDIKDLIKESLDGADRVRRIVQNLKSFSRVDEAEKKHVDINECIKSTITIVWNELKYKATLTKEYGELPLTKCYPQQINQVFMNLLVNAAHAIEKQGDIKIKTWHEDGFIFASVSDTGHGIPNDQLNKIFEPFFTTKEVGKGTGLGLSITYDIVKKHDGDIFVESVLEKGTIFTVRLPVKEV